MPSNITTRITWLSEKELEEAKKKAASYKNFSEFVRVAVKRLRSAQPK